MFGRNEKQVLTVEGMTCGHCEQRVEKSVAQIDGVKKVHASHKDHTVEVVYKKSQPPDADRIRQTIEGLGYRVK